VRIDAPDAAPPGRDLVPLERSPPPVPAGGALVPLDGGGPSRTHEADQRRAEVVGGVDIRAASPREMARLSLDLYAAGVLAYKDYAVLAFQPELHPDYDRLNSRFVGIVVESLSIRFGSQRDGSRALSGLVLACR